jgi:hypothetical protein
MQDSDNNKDTSPGKPLCDGYTPPSEGPGEAYYMNEQGLLTFTSKYLLERGYCCGNGCKHCPYNYEAVPEPRRSYLLDKRRDADELPEL